MKILVEKMANWAGDNMPDETQPDIDLPLFDVDFFPEFSEELSPFAEGEAKEQQDTVVKKRKRRKKQTLTGVSRQRREANARERRRVEEMNQAFVNLKKALPLPNVDISKMEILRLAIKWIDHLGTLLKDYEERKDLLNVKQMETSRPEDFTSIEEGLTPVKHDCIYHQFPDLKNTLWEESIGLQGRSK